MKRGFLRSLGLFWLVCLLFVALCPACGSQGDRPKVRANPSRVLVVYYSLGGGTRQVAEAIAQSLGADLAELRTREPLRIENWKPILGNREISFEDKPALLPLASDPRGYDLVFIGTPVWNWRHAVPLNTFLSESNLRGKRVALFCTYANRTGGVFWGMRQSLGGAEVIGERAFRRPLQNPVQTNQEAASWARGLLSPGGGQDSQDSQDGPDTQDGENSQENQNRGWYPEGGEE